MRANVVCRSPRDAAAKLGIPHQTLGWKIRNLNIDKLAFRRPA